jgi:hypothetical protein
VLATRTASTSRAGDTLNDWKAELQAATREALKFGKDLVQGKMAEDRARREQLSQYHERMAAYHDAKAAGVEATMPTHPDDEPDADDEPDDEVRSMSNADLHAELLRIRHS